MYVGKVLQVDEEDQDTQMSFMEKTRTQPVSFKWPLTPDKIWVAFDKILGIIEQPSSHGRSNHLFQY